MLTTILGGIFTAITSAIIIAKDSIMAFIGSMYAASKTSLGIAIPLASI